MQTIVDHLLLKRKEPKPIFFRISGVIPQIVSQSERPLHFFSCKMCKRKLLQLDDNKFSCENCQKIGSDFIKVWSFTCVLMDMTSQVYVSVLGNEIGDTIMGQTAES